jgi:hypothetical protein
VKVAVAVDAARVPRWQRDAIEALRALDGIEVGIVDIRGAAPNAFEARLGGPALESAPLAADSDGLRDAAVILNFTASALAADAPHGVWSFRLGEAAGGGLPFAREVARGDATVEIALVRRRAGEVALLRSGRFAIPLWFPTLLRLALAEAGRWPATFVAALRDGIELRASSLPAPAPPPERGTNRVRLLAALALRFAGGMRDAFFTVDQWNVGFARGGPRALLEGAPLDVTWLPDPPRRSFVADPFVVERAGMRVLFLEDFNYVRDRGVIDALVLDAENRVVRRARALDLPVHLSYPFPVEIDGELYLMPESCGANEVALYRCVAFPDRWERESAVLPGFDGVDTTLFEHEGRWWAFCTRSSSGPSLALHAFHASAPRGPWQPHRLNPIVVDVASARPAGPLFVLDGVLYRTGQDCSRTYGGSIALVRIDELSPDEYRETLVRRIAPPPGRFADGFHTISFAGDTLVVDGKRTYRDIRNIGRALRALRTRIGRALNRSRSHRAPTAQAPRIGGR